MTTSSALREIRVIDATQVRAGPKAARWFADMGAEVIKVEAVSRPDGRGARGFGGPPLARPVPQSEQRRVNRLGFDQLHRNKLGLSVNLREPRGVEIFKELASVSDVVMDNFSQGVMERLGLGYGDLREVKPDIIVVAMPAFGNTGPEKSYIGYGWAQEHLSGVSAMTGYIGGPPLRTGTVTPDPLNGVHAAGAVISALIYRARTGRGQFIDLSHWESMISIVGEWFLEYVFNGDVADRIGNRHRVWAPQGCYKCMGDDRWVALTVTSETEWNALAGVVGGAELAEDPSFATAELRQRNHDRLDSIISVWTGERDNVEAMEILQDAGVRAGASLTNTEAITSPQAQARGLVSTLVHPDGVTHPYTNSPWKFSRANPSVRFPAPLLGEHNAYILGELLGVSDEEVSWLEKEEITATLSTAPRSA